MEGPRAGGGGDELRRFRRLADLTVLATFALILVGGIVRVSESGLGCGPGGSGTEGWPLCDGAAVPFFHNTEIIVEFSHRLLGRDRDGPDRRPGVDRLPQAPRPRRPRPALAVADDGRRGRARARPGGPWRPDRREEPRRGARRRTPGARDDPDRAAALDLDPLEGRARRTRGARRIRGGAARHTGGRPDARPEALGGGRGDPAALRASSPVATSPAPRRRASTRTSATSSEPTRHAARLSRPAWTTASSPSARAASPTSS